MGNGVRKTMLTFKFSIMSDVRCPYCGEEQEINHDDDYGYEEGVLHNQLCGDCDKYFTYKTCISIDHEAFRADCLNDGNHEFKPTKTFPREYTKMRCKTCGETRKCTEEEMAQILS